MLVLMMLMMMLVLLLIMMNHDDDDAVDDVYDLVVNDGDVDDVDLDDDVAT